MTYPNLTNPSTLKQFLNEAGVEPARSAGQNFLICDEPINKVLESIADGPKNITELGAGHGPLTLALLNAGYHVKAIERDKTLASVMLKAVPIELKDHLNLILDDLRNASWTWTEEYQLVGNIPYNLSGLILRRITELQPAPTRVVLLVQKEVGQRIVSSPPDMNILSLAIQLWGEAKALINVSATCFWPQPEVQSQLIMITPRILSFDGKKIDQKEQDEIMRTAKPLFQTKRKQLAGAMARTFKIDHSATEKILLNAGVRPEQRPQELTIEQWYKVTQLLKA